MQLKFKISDVQIMQKYIVVKIHDKEIKRLLLADLNVDTIMHRFRVLLTVCLSDTKVSSLLPGQPLKINMTTLECIGMCLLQDLRLSLYLR